MMKKIKEMPVYISKPKLIRAFEVVKDMSVYDIEDTLKRHGVANATIEGCTGFVVLRCNGHSSTISNGDYIVCYGKSDVYVVKGDVFDSLYEEVDDEEEGVIE